MANHFISNGLEITTGRLKRVRKQLRVENDMLTKSGRLVLSPSLHKFVVAEIHNIAHYGIEKTFSLLKDRFIGRICLDTSRCLCLHVRYVEKLNVKQALPKPL